MERSGIIIDKVGSQSKTNALICMIVAYPKSFRRKLYKTVLRNKQTVYRKACATIETIDNVNLLIKHF